MTDVENPAILETVAHIPEVHLMMLSTAAQLAWRADPLASRVAKQRYLWQLFLKDFPDGISIWY